MGLYDSRRTVGVEPIRLCTPHPPADKDARRLDDPVVQAVGVQRLRQPHVAIMSDREQQRLEQRQRRPGRLASLGRVDLAQQCLGLRPVDEIVHRVETRAPLLSAENQRFPIDPTTGISPSP